MLRLDGISCGYGSMVAVENLSLSIQKGEVLALLGANGAGKSSTIGCVAGHVDIFSGKVIYGERDITALTPMDRVRIGIALVPEGRRLFKNLTVKENLIVGGYSRSKIENEESEDRVSRLFPRLKERYSQKAGSLSGGEQQMLAIGRALMSKPELLLVDELSLGLMPKAIDLCYQAISDLTEEGLTILLVEQSTERALEIADNVVVLESGRTVWQGEAEKAANDSKMIEVFLGMVE